MHGYTYTILEIGSINVHANLATYFLGIDLKSWIVDHASDNFNSKPI